MSADEIELTFVRCPNCKCLMPSAADKCGMCGFQRGEAAESRSKNRLRQQSDINISETITSTQRNEPVVPPVNKPSQVEPTKVHDKPKEDGLRFRFGKEEGENRNYLNLNQKNKDSNIENKEKLNFAEKEVEEEDDLGEYDSGDEFDDSIDDDSINNEEPSSSNSSPRFDAVGTGDKPRKRRRKRKRKNLNQQLDESKESASVIVHERKPSFQEPTAAKVQIDDRFDPRPVDVKPIVHDIPEVRQERTPVEERKIMNTPNQFEERPRKEMVDGRLLGWLVNYSTNSKGVSFELRSGRRFVGRQALRQDDIIIPDSALSTPHSLLQVEDGQIFIQDLMSENGTFVKSSSGTEFVRKDSSVKLSHGDVVKFGSYELIVCLIPGR